VEVVQQAARESRLHGLCPEAELEQLEVRNDAMLLGRQP